MGQDGNLFSAWYDTFWGYIVTLQGGVLSGGRREGGIGRVRSALTLLMVW